MPQEVHLWREIERIRSITRDFEEVQPHIEDKEEEEENGEVKGE